MDGQIQEQQSAVQPNLSSQPIQKNNNKQLHLVILLLAFLLLISVFYIFISKRTQRIPEIIPKNQLPTVQNTQPTKLEVLENTSDWKTWSSPENSFYLQFKYPNNWQYYTDSGGVGYDDIVNGYYGLSIGYQSNPNKLPLETFIKGITQFTKTATKTPIEVGNKTGLLIENSLDDVYYTTVYVAYNDEKILEINANSNKNINQEIFKKILSTFQFSE